MKDEEFIISNNVVKHVFRRHRDWISMLGLRSIEEIRIFMVDVLRKPDEVYRDVFHDNVRYFLRRMSGDLWLCIVTVGPEVHTAYLISQKKYNKYRVTRWL
ncbi:MAG: hypothetical protein QXU47_01785 [Candidatus Bathyarchaeia archaeon]